MAINSFTNDENPDTHLTDVLTASTSLGQYS